MKFKTEVLIVGGGITGVGIARDLSLRRIPCILIEKGDLASGASGRNHGLLHSGARYAVTDPQGAVECIAENQILRRIAPHCIEETGGFFLSLPEDDLRFRDQFLKSCEEAKIPTHLLSKDQALTMEPELNPEILSAIEVPDGAVHSFHLVIENAKDAEAMGASFLLNTQVTSLQLDGNKVKGVKAKNLISGEEYLIEPSFLINATGAWTNQFLGLADLKIEMTLSKGSMLITNQRLNHRVINHCRPPSDGDIIVPNETVSILGTTSIRSSEIENFEVTPQEVSLLIQETSRLIPSIQEVRFIRAYAGIRPLFQSGGEEGDRTISRSFALIDHEARDGLKNLITITGGKLITYRLMAEKASDLICEKMGVRIPCSTHLKPLPGANQSPPFRTRLKKLTPSLSKVGKEILCDCELVDRNEVEKVLSDNKLKEPLGILHRTRLAKGTCQGGFCLYRLLGVLHETGVATENSSPVLKRFLEERWKGIRPILWADALGQEELMELIYKGLFNLNH